MRVLIVGAGVIGSVYGSKLMLAGHEVVFLARGSRLTDLETCGLVMEDARSGVRTTQEATVVSDVAAAQERFDLVLVSVGAGQLAGVLPILTGMQDRSDVLLFGNLGDHATELTTALSGRALFGFPAAGGIRTPRPRREEPAFGRREWLVLAVQTVLAALLALVITPRRDVL